jgi:hypothetical protein
VIKRITFASRRTDLTRASFASVWPEAVAGSSEAPAELRPVRVTVATSLAQLMPGDAPHDGVATAWFTDDEHLAQFDAWLGTAHGRSVRGRIVQLIDDDASSAIVAEEAILRGADWLDEHWREGSDQLKHLVLARRAPGLSSAEFADRSQARGVRSGTDLAATVVPDEVGGRAYVENHPCALETGDWAYDAVNEAYFDDLDSLRARIAWFESHEAEATGDELFGPSRFLAVREVIVLPMTAPA